MRLDSLSQNLESYLDLLSARQKLVAGNLANADTPGYKTQDLDFAAELRRAGAGHTGLPPEAVEVTGLRVKNDGNNVSVDREARLLSENAMRFNMASNLLRAQVRMLRTAIQEGKGV
jgi:flagellar basal-body rod protein FlgB